MGVLAFVDAFGILPHRPLFAGKASSEIQIDDFKKKSVCAPEVVGSCMLLVNYSVGWYGAHLLAVQN